VRLFTAVELGDEVQEVAGALVGNLRRRAEEIAPRARVTWVAQNRLHLTLRFIGEVDDRQGEQVIAVLRQPIDESPFTVRWEGLGAFPAKGPPRVLWVGIGHGADQLIRIESIVSGRLQSLGIPREERPYNPHLTLARVREAGGLRASKLFESQLARLGESQVEAITLFQSKLSPKGPTYVVLERTSLRGFGH
jgi:2'-5' RNA ligase